MTRNRNTWPALSIAPILAAFLSLAVIADRRTTAQATSANTPLEHRGTIFASPIDPRLLRFKDDDGVTYEVRGQKDEQGLATAVTGVSVSLPTGEHSTLELDGGRRPLLLTLDGAGYVRYVWRSQTLAHMTAYTTSGSLLA